MMLLLSRTFSALDLFTAVTPYAARCVFPDPNFQSFELTTFGLQSMYRKVSDADQYWTLVCVNWCNIHIFFKTKKSGKKKTLYFCA